MDGCWVRDQWLLPSEQREALARPVTRRLVVDGVGHYVDRGHRHVVNSPRGLPFTVVFVCMNGKGWIRVGETSRKLVAGSAVLLPAGIPHSYGPIDMPWSLWWCTLVGSDTEDLIETIGAATAEPIIRLHDPTRLVGMIDEIATIYERRESPTQVLEASGTAWKLLTGISADRSTTLEDPIQRATEFLAENYDRAISIPELAARVGMSHSRLTKLFRQKTGKGVLAYQIDLRMSKARTLLEETDDIVSEIAARVGYSDPYYFSRHFSLLNRMSPSAYRAEHRTDPRRDGS
jgi:AraC-like DNA-binding protein